MVSVHDVLDFLVSRGAAPSSMGAQLDRLKYGVAFVSDPVRARDEAEYRLLEQANLLRCIDRFGERHEFKDKLDRLRQIQRTTHLSQGLIALSILRAYHEWGSKSKERGLAAVYQYISSIAPKQAPVRDANELHQAFRSEGGAARRLASEAYADAFLALEAHVRTYNKRTN